jgi:putative hydrolase of the HAD superfamily
LPKAVLFDLGNTLARYYELSEFPAILEESIVRVGDYLSAVGVSIPPEPGLSERVKQENHESKDFQVRPLEERIGRIFQLDESKYGGDISSSACRRFMEPIFALGRVYDDVLAPLKELHSSGYKIGLISNTPWGSPAPLWREELERLGLDDLLDTAVFCRDVGWRKPDRRIFESVLLQLNVTAAGCVFVGDEPRWDVVGPRSVGMNAIVIDRQRRLRDEYPEAIDNLNELPMRLRD